MTTLDQRNISNLHNQIQYFNNNPLIPSDLRITINTGVPGFQSIIYKPQMSIPDTKEKKIWFTPLVRLNQRIVDQVPPEYRIKQFFNKGLYESLLRYHGIVPIKKEDHELEDAERGAATAAKNVSLAENNVEKAQHRVAAAKVALRNVSPPTDRQDDDEDYKDHDMMGGGLSEAFDRYRKKSETNSNYKKYLYPDEYKQYIKNKNFIEKKLVVNDVKDSAGKIIKDGTYKERKKLRDLMEMRKKADETRKNADKKAADKKAHDKIISEVSAANDSLDSARDELKQKQSDKKASDINVRRIKADKADPDKNKVSAKADAVWALNEAKTRGNFNNNIKVTLDTLFKNGNVLYIDKKPYVIVDTQMIQGDWSLDVKPAEMATIYHTSQSAVYEKEEQGRRVLLEAAELGSFTGENWIDRYPQFDKKNSRSTLNPQVIPPTNPNPQQLSIEPKYPNGEIVTSKNRGRNQFNTYSKLFPPKKQIEQQKRRAPTLEETLIPKINKGLRQKEKYETSIKKYFGINSNNKLRGIGLIFYKNVNILLTEVSKRRSDDFGNRIEADFTRYSTRTGSVVKTREFTQNHYIDVIQSINVYENIGGGHCFFDAIAQALNLHNVSQPTESLLKSKCETTKNLDYEFFDQVCIRKIVIDTMIDYLDIIRDKEVYNSKTEEEKKDLDSRFGAILKEFKSEIKIDNFKKFQTDLRHSTIDDLKNTIETEIPKSGYLGSEHTMKFFTLGSQKYIGIELNIVVIREANMGNIYEIHEEFRDIKRGQHVIFLLNVNQGQHTGVVTEEAEGYQNHYVLLTFKERSGLDRSIFTLDQIPFVFWCYIILFTIVHEKLFTQSNLDESEKFLLTKNFTSDILITHNSLLGSNKAYRDSICAFFKKTDGPCEPTQYVVNDARSKGRKKSSKNVSFSDDVKLPVRVPVRTPKHRSSRNKLSDSSSEIESQTDRSDGDESNAETTDNDSMSGSPYYQYGGLNEVEKHREDYQRNNYTRYPGIPVAYPVENARVEDIDKSISSVFVTIDLELHKGKTISNSELASSKCNHQYNAIKHSFAVLTGTPYIIAPVYGGTRRVRRSNGTHKKRRNVRNTSRKRRNITNKRR